MWPSGPIKDDQRDDVWIPECRLHSARFDVPETGDGFVAVVARILGQQSDDGRAGSRHAYALANTCHGVSERILDLITQNPGVGRTATSWPGSPVSQTPQSLNPRDKPMASRVATR